MIIFFSFSGWWCSAVQLVEIGWKGKQQWETALSNRSGLIFYERWTISQPRLIKAWEPLEHSTLFNTNPSQVVISEWWILPITTNDTLLSPTGKKSFFSACSSVCISGCLVDCLLVFVIQSVSLLVFLCLWACVCVFVCMCVFVHVSVCVCVCVCGCVCLSVCTFFSCFCQILFEMVWAYICLPKAVSVQFRRIVVLSPPPQKKFFCFFFFQFPVTSVSLPIVLIWPAARNSASARAAGAKQQKLTLIMICILFVLAIGYHFRVDSWSDIKKKKKTLKLTTDIWRGSKRGKKEREKDRNAQHFLPSRVPAWVT